MARDPIVKRFTKVGGGVTAHSHVRVQFRCLGNHSALTLKPHQKQTYLFRARSYIAIQGVLLVLDYMAFISAPSFTIIHTHGSSEGHEMLKRNHSCGTRRQERWPRERPDRSRGRQFGHALEMYDVRCGYGDVRCTGGDARCTGGEGLLIGLLHML